MGIFLSATPDPDKPDNIFVKSNEFGVVIHELGILFVTIVPIIFVYERVLRNFFLSEMEEKMKTVVGENIPEHIENIRESGVIDVFNKLKYDIFIKKLEKTAKTKVRFFKIWIPSFETIKECLYDLIVHKQSEVEVILLHPHSHEAMEKRGRQYKYTKERIRDHIIENLRDLCELHEKLPDNFKNKLKVKLHKDFISISLVGIENYFWIGFYLAGRVATEGTQIKIHGRGAFFYLEIYNHFMYQWERSEQFDLSNPEQIDDFLKLDNQINN